MRTKATGTGLKLTAGVDSSDADPEILSDYTLALFESDVADEEIRKSAIENLEDFLKARELIVTPSTEAYIDCHPQIPSNS